MLGSAVGSLWRLGRSAVELQNFRVDFLAGVGGGGYMRILSIKDAFNSYWK
jgi:hypothetical protein